MTKEVFYKNRAPRPGSELGPERDCCEQLESAYRSFISSFGPAFLSTDREIANMRPKESSWSFLECLMHLILTVRPYLELLNALELEDLQFDRKAESFFSSLFTKQIIRSESPGLKVPAPRALKPEYRIYEPQKVCAELVLCYEELLKSLNRVPEDSVLAGVRLRLPTFPLFKCSLEQIFLLHLMHGRRHLAQGLKAVEIVRQL